MSVVKFNVGGVHYDTTLTTLRNVPDNMLLQMVESPLTKDKHNRRIFIDRDGQLFSEILGYLRDPENFSYEGKKKAALAREASFYCLFDMAKLLSTEKEFPIVIIDVAVFGDKGSIVVYPPLFELDGLRLFSNQAYGQRAMTHNIDVLERAGYTLISTLGYSEQSGWIYEKYVFSANER